MGVTKKVNNNSIFPSDTILKLERAQSTAKQNKDLTLNPHKQQEQQ